MGQNWDRHEIKVRSDIEHIVKDYRQHGDLYGIPKDLQKDIFIFGPEDIQSMTEQLYELVRNEMSKHAQRGGEDKVN